MAQPERDDPSLRFARSAGPASCPAGRSAARRVSSCPELPERTWQVGFTVSNLPVTTWFNGPTEPDKNDCKITRYAYSIHQILRCRRFRHAVDFGITFLGKEKLRLNKYVANSLGFISAASTNYVLNRLWTFHSRDPQVAQQYMQFIGISAIGLLINNLIIYLLNDRARVGFYLSKLIAIGVVTLWNFFMNYFFTFTS